MRALGFRSGSVVFSFMIEALLIAGIGGAIGCLAALPLNGFTTSTLNFQTFSSIAFAFRITPAVLGRRHDLCSSHGDYRRHAARDSRGSQPYFHCATWSLRFLDFREAVR